MTTTSMQAQFDTIAEHLLTQNRKSLDRSGECVYRGPNGARCAIGAIIPPEAYKPNMEGENVLTLLEQDLRPLLALSDADSKTTTDFYIDMQNIHDANEPEDWPKLLAESALERGLDTSIITDTAGDTHVD